MNTETISTRTARELRSIDDYLQHLERILDGETELPEERFKVVDKLFEIANDYAQTLRQVQSRLLRGELG